MTDAHSTCIVRTPSVTVTESSLGLHALRVRNPLAAQQALQRMFKVWPMVANGIVGADPEIAWLTPTEWALLGRSETLLERVQAACQGLTFQLTDLSAGRRLWSIEGLDARALLAKGCSIDTDARVFPVGVCAQTLLAQVPVLIIPRDGAESVPRFSLVGDLSHAGHLRAWFDDASLEYRL